MKTTLTLLTMLVLAGASLPASATTTFNVPALSNSAASGAVTVLARRGADDPAGHDVGDDKGGQRGKHETGGKGRGGHDDGANHS